MKLMNVQKHFSALILIILLVNQFSLLTVFADTEPDPDKPVSDLFNKDSESEMEDRSDTKADVPPTDPTTQKESVGTSAGDYIKTLFALLFVIGLLFGLLKFVNRKNKLYDKSRFMKNMGGISLGQQKSIQLVVIGEAYYLIGVGDDIRLLKEITDPEEINKLIEFYNTDTTDSPTGMLNQLLVKVAGKSKKSPYENSGESTDFSNLFKSRIEEMKEERKRHIGRLTEKERNRDE
jgi:flagellar protein FliO/FliZ